MLGWGQFVTVLINFLILAFIIFLIVRSANRMTAKAEEAPAAGGRSGRACVLLREIRDELRKQALSGAGHFTLSAPSAYIGTCRFRPAMAINCGV